MRLDLVTATCSRILSAIVVGSAMTIGIAWWAAATVDYHVAGVSEGWLTPPPSDWLVRRYDAPASTRVAWLFHEETATAREAQRRQRQLIVDKNLAPDSPLALAMQRSWQQRRQRIVNWQTFMYHVREDIAPSLLPTPLDSQSNTFDHGSVIIDARGWPLRAMWAGFHTTSHPGYSAAATDQFCLSAVHAIPLGLNPGGRGIHTARALPLGIVSVGFAIDALIYALAWVASCLALRAAVAWVRRRVRPDPR